MSSVVIELRISKDAWTPPPVESVIDIWVGAEGSFGLFHCAMSDTMHRSFLVFSIVRCPIRCTLSVSYSDIVVFEHAPLRSQMKNVVSNLED